MFSIQELQELESGTELRSDLHRVQQSLVNTRIRQRQLIEGASYGNLNQYVEAVLASAPTWERDARWELCARAGEIAEALASQADSESRAARSRFRAALLYELAALPALSAAVLENGDLPELLMQYFNRTGRFKLMGDGEFQNESPDGHRSLVHSALIDDATSYATAAQRYPSDTLRSLAQNTVANRLRRLAEFYSVDITATESAAFSEILRQRTEHATVANLSGELVPAARSMGFPVELLPAQAAALSSGMLDTSIPAWGFASPTGSGKTYLARLAIAETLRCRPEAKVLYLVPSRALVTEVGEALAESVRSLGHSAIALSAQLLDLDANEAEDVSEASVVVLTPEKADLLIRLNTEFLQEVSLVIVDEAHHIESGTRGALLEMYLWRLQRILPSSTRYQFLSAVTPNIGDITKWMSRSGQAVTYDHRPTRMRVGVYSVTGSGKNARGNIRYVSNSDLEVVPTRADKRIKQGLAQLAEAVSKAGPVLIVAKGKRECEKVAAAIVELLGQGEEPTYLTPEEKDSDTYRRLDASLEREMYADVELRSLVRTRVAYHHAGLPPHVRQNVEAAIRSRLVRFVVATTTLAEGVNFPFSTVIVQSLSLQEPPEKGRSSRYSPVTPRTFWNIAGRAGRPGFDAEGQVILYEPSLGLDKINAVIEPYLQPELASLEPVESALAHALREINDDIEAQRYSTEDLSSLHLPNEMSRRARGAINLVRVGVMHAKASKIAASPEEIVDGTFASQFMDDKDRRFAKTLFATQGKAVQDYLESDEALDVPRLAELGLSLETLADIRAYVRQLEDWQIKSFNRLFYGKKVNLKQAQYIVGPVAKHMSELEGRKLGGFLSGAIIQWISGVPFTTIRKESAYRDRLEDLIAVIHSRVQFLLPWGLWVANWLVEVETERRSINYDDQIKKLAYLADSGVPDFDALRLTHLGFERVDATRLSNLYSKQGGEDLGVDVVGWLSEGTVDELESAVRGRDGRRLEYGFRDRIRRLRSRSNPG